MQLTFHFYAQLTIAIIKGVASCLRLFHMLGIIILFSSLSLSLYAIEQPSNTQIKQVYLHDKQGNSINIGQLYVHEDGQFSFERRDEAFTDHFLSMKEMKCLEGPELWCHIAYPYPLNRDFNADKAWLSHDLLFMYKKSNQFGAKLWQGVYYKFTHEDGRLIGYANGVDLNEIASAPDQTDTPFYNESYMEPHNSEERWLPTLTID